MAKINMTVTLDSPEEKSQKKLAGDLMENQISYVDGGFFVNLKWEKDQLILTKANKDYKITLNLQKDKSQCVYEDLHSQMGLTMRVSNETFIIGNDYIALSYVIEDRNEINYRIEYEVQE